MDERVEQYLRVLPVILTRTLGEPRQFSSSGLALADRTSHESVSGDLRKRGCQGVQDIGWLFIRSLMDPPRVQTGCAAFSRALDLCKPFRVEFLAACGMPTLQEDRNRDES